MRLSEAIRLGAMLRPQAFGVAYDGESGGTCAMGAAADAVGALNHRSGCYDYERIPKEWLAVDSFVRHRALCPSCGLAAEYNGDKGTVQNTIVHLNNYHKWTREQIADWVQTIEAQHEPKPDLVPEMRRV